MGWPISVHWFEDGFAWLFWFRSSYSRLQTSRGYSYPILAFKTFSDLPFGIRSRTSAMCPKSNRTGKIQAKLP